MDKTVEILGVKVDRVEQYEALARIGVLAQTEGLSQVVTLNPEYVMRARREPELMRIINGADLCVPDGSGITWAAKRLGQPLKGRVTGTGLLPEICRISARKGYSVFFLGGKPGVAELAADELTRRFPELKVAGISGNDPGPLMDDITVTQINNSGARVLAVAYGCPKQDHWIDAHRNELTSVRMAIGVGGAFDFISGEIPRAPRWMRRIGMEWLYRLLQEPTRLGRMLALPRFGVAVLRSRGEKKPNG
ncbi:MAG: WecB/TagA/CpsF family glycosyltransferase [Thermoleophilia bacterium]